MHTNHSKHRRGSSLIIMLATIAAGAAIVGLAVLVLIRMLGFGSAAGDHLARTVSVARLAEQFRSDVAAARSADVAEPAAKQIDTGDRPKAEGGNPSNDDADSPAVRRQRLKLTLGEGHTVIYDIHDGAIERIVEQDGQRKHSEQYAPAGLTAKLPALLQDRAKANLPQFARLRLDRTPLVESHSPHPARSIVIEAQVGRDQRFSPREARP